MKREKREKQKVVELDALAHINPNAAGIDVGSEAFYVAVPAGRAVESVRTFGTFTADLHRLANWLKECQIETVAMESTGVIEPLILRSSCVQIPVPQTSSST